MMSFKKIHFEISERKILLQLFDVISVLLSLYFVSIIFKFDYFSISTLNYYWTLVLAIYLVLFGHVFEMYNLQVASNQFLILKSIVLTVSTTVLVYLLTPIYTPLLPKKRIQILCFYLAILITLLVWRYFYITFLASHRFHKKVILICDTETVSELIDGLEKVDPNYKVVGFIQTDLAFNEVTNSLKIKQIANDDLAEFVKNNYISELVIATQKPDSITIQLYNQLIHLLESGFTIREYSQVYESITQRIPVNYLAQDFYRYFPFSRSNQNKLYLLISRLIEMFICLFGLTFGVLFLPLILIINPFANQGSLFYFQERVGKNGVVFNIYKLRTMIKNAESDQAVFATSNDSRVTAFGKFLRKTRIDEIPQFINILKGDMSIIGPRPERPIIVNEIAKEMPFYETRHIIKPGLTGWAQVNYSYGESIEDSLIKLQYDLYYIKHRSIFLDLNIMLKTLSTVLFYRGQ